MYVLFVLDGQDGLSKMQPSYMVLLWLTDCLIHLIPAHLDIIISAQLIAEP